jgi:hypothetical protein
MCGTLSCSDAKLQVAGAGQAQSAKIGSLAASTLGLKYASREQALLKFIQRERDALLNAALSSGVNIDRSFPPRNSVH